MAESSFALLALAATTAHGASEKGMGSSFLQSSGAQVLKKAVQGKNHMNDGDRNDLLPSSPMVLTANMLQQTVRSLGF